jgi:hypothetical protein
MKRLQDLVIQGLRQCFESYNIGVAGELAECT